MKFLFLVRSLNRAGAEKQIITLANGLSNIGETVTVAVFYKGGALEGNLNPSIDFIDLGKSSRWDLFNFAIRFLRMVNRGRYDVLYSFLVPPNLLALLTIFINKRPKIVWGIRDADVDYSEYGLMRRLLAFAQLGTMGLPDQIIVNSQAALEELLKKRGELAGKLKCVANGIDTDYYKINNEKSLITRKKLGLSENVKLITTLAREDPKKGHEYFLRAAAEVCKVKNDYIFVCAGAVAPEFEQYSSYLRDLTSQLGLSDRVKWIGEVDDVLGIINASNLVTLTSIMGEGFPNVIGEAMACERPVVATNVGDSSIIVDDSECVVSPKCYRSLSEAWMLILEKSLSDIENMGARNRDRVHSNYSVTNMVQNTLLILRNC